MLKALVLAWWFAYPCLIIPGDVPVGVYVGPFVEKSDCDDFVKKIAMHVDPLLVSETTCMETHKPTDIKCWSNGREPHESVGE